MDSHGSIGMVGLLGSFGLAEYHLFAASFAATLTAVYMSVAIYNKLKK